MKRKLGWLLIAALSTATLFHGCDLFSKLIWGVAGDWALTFQWNGSPENTATWILLKDHSFSDSWGNGGAWESTGSDFRLVYAETPSAVYIGTVARDLDSISGTMSNNLGGNGTWSAVRTVIWSFSKEARGKAVEGAVPPKGLE